MMTTKETQGRSQQTVYETATTVVTPKLDIFKVDVSGQQEPVQPS